MLMPGDTKKCQNADFIYFRNSSNGPLVSKCVVCGREYRASAHKRDHKETICSEILVYKKIWTWDPAKKLGMGIFIAGWFRTVNDTRPVVVMGKKLTMRYHEAIKINGIEMR